MSKTSLEYQRYLKDPNIIDPSFINEKLGLNLQDILKEHIPELLVVTDFSRMDAQHKGYLESFPDLTYKLYRLLVLKTVYEEVPMLFERFKDEIEEWIHKTKDAKRKILLDIKELELGVLSNAQLKEFVPIKNGIIEHSFYNLNVKIMLSKKITNVLTVFKEFPLSYTIPLIFTKIDKKITTKVYTEPFLDKSVIKTWTDKAKTKIDKSIVFRLKVSDGNYAKVVLYDNVLLVKYIFTSKDQVNFYNAKEFVKNNVKPLIKNINYILNENVSIQDIDIKYTTIKINTKSFRDVFYLKDAIKTKFTKQFTVLPMKYKKLLTLKYNENTIQINNTDNQFVTYFSIRNYSDFKDTINALTHVFIAAKTAKTKEPKKNVKNIELLKQEGIKIDSKGCQKRRQPVITTKTDNVFLYKNKGIVCNNSVYPHPGFTDNNVLCCFKKNQTKKEAYIRNTSNTTQTNDNIILLNKPILKTIGSTPRNRIAILNVLIEKALNKVLQNGVPFVFYRLGNSGDEFAHLFNKKMPESFLKNEEVLRYVDNGSYFGKTLKIQDVPYVTKLEIMSIFYKTNFLFIDVNKIIKIITNEAYRVVILYKTIKKIENIICIDNQEVIKFFSLPETKKEYIIKKQYVNPLNKVTFLETNYGIIPIKPRVIYIGVPFTENIKELQHQEASQQYDNLQSIAFKVQEQIISDLKTIGLLVNNVIVPTKKSEQIPSLKTQEYQGIQDPDLILKSSSTLFNKEIIKDLIYQMLRYLLSFLFKTHKIQDLQHLEDYIIITKDTLINTQINIPKDTNLFICEPMSKDPFCKNGKLVIPKDLFNIFIQKISQDLQLKNKEGMQIVKGTVKKYILGPNNYIKKRNEKIIKK